MKKWILVAEDNTNDADLTLRALDVPHESVDVVIAHDGLEALDCVNRRGIFAGRSGLPVMVLLDLKMPKVDGFEVLQQIKSDPILKCIPVVVFSSSREKKDIARCYAAGANAYLVKPLKFKDLSSALSSLRSFWLALNELPQLEVALNNPAFMAKMAARSPRANS